MGHANTSQSNSYNSTTHEETQSSAATIVHHGEARISAIPSSQNRSVLQVKAGERASSLQELVLLERLQKAAKIRLTPSIEVSHSADSKTGNTRTSNFGNEPSRTDDSSETSAPSNGGQASTSMVEHLGSYATATVALRLLELKPSLSDDELWVIKKCFENNAHAATNVEVLASVLGDQQFLSHIKSHDSSHDRTQRDINNHMESRAPFKDVTQGPLTPQSTDQLELEAKNPTKVVENDEETFATAISSPLQTPPQSKAELVSGNVASKNCTCRAKRRRCLHDADGQLSPDLCRRYIRDGHVGTNSGRSRKQLDEIKAAAGKDIKSLSGPKKNFVLEIDESPTNTRDGPCSSPKDDDSDSDRPLILSRKGSKRVQESERPSAATTSKMAKARELRGVELQGKQNPLTELLRSKGVLFESDSDDDDEMDDSPAQLIHNRLQSHPALKTSMNLFDIAPELRFDPSDKILSKPRFTMLRSGQKTPKKQLWKNLLAFQCQERRAEFGNPHWQVDRQFPEREVTTIVQHELKGPDAPLATLDNIETKQIQTTFSKFMGMPQEPIVCRGKVDQELAYRDGNKDREKEGLRGFRADKRITNEEKFPFTGYA